MANFFVGRFLVVSHTPTLGEVTCAVRLLSIRCAGILFDFMLHLTSNSTEIMGVIKTAAPF